MWCSPYFDPSSIPAIEFTNPPSSTPRDIYGTLQQAVQRKDRHNTKINDNRVGLLKGAYLKKQDKIITTDQHKEIVEIIEEAGIQDFRPLLYIIPGDPVANLIKDVPVQDRAHPLSLEYIIERLPRGCFDFIEY